MDIDGSSNEESIPQRVSKMRRSCELCRGHKARCCPSEDDSNRCQRCARDGKQCVFLETKARPKRARNSRARVAEMEEKLDGLLAILHSQGHKDKQTLPAKKLTPPTAPVFSLPNTQESTLSDLSDIPTPLSFPLRHEVLNNTQQHPLFSFPITALDNLQDVISKGVIDFNLAEGYVRFFQTKSINFPFVLVPPRMSLDTLRRERPFLLLSILAFSAQSNMKLQKALELELRESLSRRVVVNGEKSLDLLQGVLVYLAWYQFYFKPERQQIYQLTQMAVAMAVDLGIHESVQGAPSTNFDVLNTVMPLAVVHKLPPNEPEVRRAFLGCYYLTSSVCQTLRKPNNMKYNNYIDECSSVLAQAPQVESDHLLQYFIRLQHFSEEVNSAFDYDSLHNLPALDSARIEILVKAFNRQLNQFQETFPLEIWDNVQITMAYYFLRIYVNEVGYHVKAPSPLDLLTSQSTVHNWYYSGARSECLLQCLQASKDYLDRFLSLPSERLIDFILPDFIRLIYAILVLGAFARGCDSPNLDIPQIRQTTNLSYYLDSLVDKTGLYLKSRKDGKGADYMEHLNKLFQQTKCWHAQMMMDPSAMGNCILGHPEFSLGDILPAVINLCVEFQGACVEVVDEQDQWADMLTNWSAGDLDPVSLSMSSTA